MPENEKGRLERVDIDNMPAGREMDVLVAERVMGWEYEHPVWRLPSGGFVVYKPVFSISISAAWEVVEKMRISVIQSEDGWYAAVTEDVIHTFSCNNPPNISKEVHGKYWAVAEIAPLAICRAALKAVTS